jgi:hypothetical protein
MVEKPARIDWSKLTISSESMGPGSEPALTPPEPPQSECEDPALRSLLVPYVLCTATEAQENAFEAHCLACDRCFADLKVLDRAQEIVRHWLDTRPLPRRRPKGRRSITHA